ncbi:hypothetical protein IMZ48_44295 [Candidatus Bathyarchaeota archaeon]|nr:hypothetical protein [Candidatus Bathyarchaeota archaeon]
MELAVSLAEHLIKVSLDASFAVFVLFMLSLTLAKEAPTQVSAKDEDGRLPIHWAASSNSAAIVQMLSDVRGFDPDVQVGSHP